MLSFVAVSSFGDILYVTESTVRERKPCNGSAMRLLLRWAISLRIHFATSMCSGLQSKPTRAPKREIEEVDHEVPHARRRRVSDGGDPFSSANTDVCVVVLWV
jgi:hypothetical protein